MINCHEIYWRNSGVHGRILLMIAGTVPLCAYCFFFEFHFSFRIFRFFLGFLKVLNQEHLRGVYSDFRNEEDEIKVYGLR